MTSDLCTYFDGPFWFKIATIVEAGKNKWENWHKKKKKKKKKTWVSWKCVVCLQKMFHWSSSRFWVWFPALLSQCPKPVSWSQIFGKFLTFSSNLRHFPLSLDIQISCTLGEFISAHFWAKKRVPVPNGLFFFWPNAPVTSFHWENAYIALKWLKEKIKFSNLTHIH